MKLYSFFRSSASYRVRIALALKGLHYETISVPMRDNSHRSESYRKVNPQMRLPALALDDGNVLIQSLAIVEYLDEVYPEPRLLPADPIERAQVRAVAQIISCDIHPLNNTGTRGMLTSKFGADEKALNEWTAYWIHEGFNSIERLLQPGPYAFGDAITLADLCIVPQVYNAHRYNVPLDDYRKILAVDASARQHPAFAAAAPEAQPDAA
ncbi:MAG: maleylacetoacetate isomerase [Bradyrhizobiaceae bacterium]|nr:maleylacetoacetate isomerase [Bradyrhizobiaceae bacterium]